MDADPNNFWHNIDLPGDVNGDGSVTAADANMIATFLEGDPSGSIPVITPYWWPGGYFDVTNNFVVDSADFDEVMDILDTENTEVAINALAGVNEGENLVVSGTSENAEWVEVTLDPDVSTGGPYTAFPAQDGTWSVTLPIFDDDPSGTPQDTLAINVAAGSMATLTVFAESSVTVRNVDPVVTILSIGPAPADGSPGALIEENQEVTLQIEVLDVGEDEGTVTIDWGDGSALDFVPLMPTPGSPQVFTVYHTYGFLPTGTLSELYNIVVTVVDDDTGSATADASVFLIGAEEPTSLPEVSITATDDLADEVPTDWGTFVVSRTGPTTGPLQVKLDFGGTASRGYDYETTNVGGWNIVTIPAGQSEVEVTVKPKADAHADPDETVVASIINYSGLWTTPYTIGQSPATVTIEDGWGRVSIEWVGGSQTVEDSGGSLEFRVAFWGDTASQSTIYVSLSTSGAADFGTDYTIDDAYPLSTPNINSIPIILGGSDGDPSYTTLYVVPKPDPNKEGDEDFTITITGVTGGPGGSIDPQHDSISGTIQDDEPTVTIEARNPEMTEGESFYGRFLISRVGSTSFPIHLSIDVSGDATPGLDYAWPNAYSAGVYYIGHDVVIPAGISAIYVKLKAFDDAVPEETEAITWTLVENSEYYVGSPDSATITITDNDQVAENWEHVWSPSDTANAYGQWEWYAEGSYWRRGKVSYQYEAAGGIQGAEEIVGAPLNKSFTYSLSDEHSIQVGVSWYISIFYQYSM